MDTTLDYFHKQLTSRRDKDHRAERILARSYPARYKRYFIQFFLNYFKYNVYIYIYTEQAFSIEEEMKRFFEDAASGVTHLSHFRNSRGPAWSRVQIFRDKNVEEEEEGMTAGWNLLFTTGLYNHLAMHLFAESKVHPEIGNMCCQYVAEGRMNLSCCLDSSIPVGTMSTALRNTCFSVTLATLARYSTLNTFYTLPWLRSTGRKDLIRNMCFFFPLIILPSFPGMMEIRDVTEEEQRT